MIKETYSITEEEISVKIAGSEPESLRTKRIRRTGVRVYKDGHIGVSGYLGDGGEAGALKRAEDALAYRIPYPCEPEKSLQKSETGGGRPFTAEALDAEAAAVLAALKKDFPSFVFSSSGIKSGTETVTLKNDAGLDLSWADTQHRFAVLYKRDTSASIIDGWFGFSGPKYDRAAFLANAGEILGAHMNEVPLPSGGRLPVFFEDFEQLPVSIFYRELEGMTFGSGGSIFSGKAGQRLFSEGVTIINDRKRSHQPFFDAEGVRGEGFAYVENGVLKAPFCDKKTAAKFGFIPSGDASAAYDAVPATAAGSMAIKPQAKTVKDMLGGQPAVYVMIAGGGDFTSEGAFGTPVQLAFLMKDGRLVGRLPELQLSSHVYDMYGKDFLGVSSDTVMPLSDSRWLGFMMDVKKG